MPRQLPSSSIFRSGSIHSIHSCFTSRTDKTARFIHTLRASDNTHNNIAQLSNCIRWQLASGGYTLVAGDEAPDGRTLSRWSDSPTVQRSYYSMPRHRTLHSSILHDGVSPCSCLTTPKHRIPCFLNESFAMTNSNTSLHAP